MLAGDPANLLGGGGGILRGHDDCAKKPIVGRQPFLGHPIVHCAGQFDGIIHIAKCGNRAGIVNTEDGRIDAMRSHPVLAKFRGILRTRGTHAVSLGKLHGMVVFRIQL